MTLWHDLLFAGRLLRKNPSFTLPAILILALGIGATATILSLADATFLRTLPVPDADRLVHVYQRRVSPGAYPLSYADYLDYKQRARSFEALAAHYSTSPMHVIVNAEPLAITGAVVSASYFEVLQISPAHGRFFTAAEDQVRDRDAVAVISHGLWERRFAKAADIVGRTIQINGEVFSIVGVAPVAFRAVRNGGAAVDVWIPSAMFRVGYRYCDGLDRSCTIVEMLGRLRPGVSRREAQAELDALARQLEIAYPSTNEGAGVSVVEARGRGQAVNATEVRQIQLFFFAAALVLLIACANVASLLVAYAIRRRREIAVRLSVGATRARLVRQLLTESSFLASAGTVAGLLLAWWSNDVMSAFQAADYAGRARDFRVDLSGRVVAATAGITVLVTILFGLLPALRASHTAVMPVLKDEGASGGARRARLATALVIGQVTLSVMLLIGAGLLVRSLHNVFAGPGFDPRPIITLRLRPGLMDYPVGKALEFQRQVIRRLEVVPGVLSASPGDGLVATPMTVAGNQRATRPGNGTNAESSVSVRTTRVGPRYFATLGVPVLEGREFVDSDDEKGRTVVVINDVLAKQLWPGGGASGRTLNIDGRPHEVVGVVKDAQYYAAGHSPHAVAYRCYWQSENGGFNKDSRTIVRVSGAARAMMATIRREVAAVDPAVPISEDYPLSTRVAFEFQSIGTARTLISTLAAIALCLSAVGLYGVLAFTVSQRARELAIRIALGASGRDVARLVLSEGIGVAVVGMALGLGGAWMSARLVSSMLYGVSSTDTLTFAAAPAILLIVALAASYLPARRAARISPVVALRYE